MHHRVDHCFAQRLIGVLRLVLAVKAADCCTHADILPQEAARLVDQLGQRSDKILAVDVGPDTLSVGVLDTDDLALRQVETVTRV